MKKQFWFIFLILFVCLWLLPSPASLQRQVGTTIKRQGAFVLEFKSPYENLTVDLDENSFTTNETSVFSISPQTEFVNNKNKPLDRTVIRRGMEIEITGERVGEQYVASRVKVKTNVEKWEVEVKGYFESLDGDKAWIDGRSVKLVPGTVVRGEDDWEKKTFHSFDEMELGSEVKVKGSLQTDGIIYATSGQTKPNKFKNADRDIIAAVKQNLIVPANLRGGKGKVLGREVKFSDSFELQEYVTRVGKRLIPRYQKDMPTDSPAKIEYRFAVIEEDSYNAFALPDGSVFVHTGLLKKIKNEAQLAAVLGHEIAHVTHEHSRKLANNWLRDVTALGILLGGAATGTKEGATAGVMGALAVTNGFDRPLEDQADRVGLYYITQAGYDVREIPKMWREMAKNSKETALNNFIYSNHSMASQRLKYINRHIAYSYYETDFSRTKTGKEEYDNVVGVHFGWYTKPIAKPIKKDTTSPTVKPPKSNPPPKQTPKKPKVRKRP